MQHKAYHRRWGVRRNHAALHSGSVVVAVTRKGGNGNIMGTIFVTGATKKQIVEWVTRTLGKANA